MPGPFAKLGAAVDWLFGEVAGTVRGTISAAEAKRILGVGIASALSGASPFLATAAASHSRNELVSAITSGFLTGVIGATVSLLHRRCDGDPGLSPPPPPPYYGDPQYCSTPENDPPSPR